MAKAPDKHPPQSVWPLWIEAVATALASGLTVRENLAQCWLKVEVEAITSRTSKALKPIALPLMRGRMPYGVSVERVELISGTMDWFPSVDWEPALKDGQPALKIINAYGLNAGARATLTLLIKAE
jgi:hypothetical protein